MEHILPLNCVPKERTKSLEVAKEPNLDPSWTLAFAESLVVERGFQPLVLDLRTAGAYVHSVVLVLGRQSSSSA